jgi:predicted PurR-regulated permease PerM
MNLVKVSPSLVVGIKVVFVFAVFAILLVYPLVKIFERAGKNKLLALLALCFLA